VLNPRQPTEVFQPARDHFIKLKIFIGINKNKNYNLKKKKCYFNKLLRVKKYLTIFNFNKKKYKVLEYLYT